MTVMVVALTVAVYYVGVGAGANRKEAEMKANPVDMTALTTRVTDLEAKDKSHEAAMTGAAQRIQGLAQTHDNWVRQSSQSQSITRGMIGLMERGVQGYIGESKWKKNIDKARAEIEADAKKRADAQVIQAKVAAAQKAKEDARIQKAVDKVLKDKAKADAKKKAEAEAKAADPATSKKDEQ